MKYLFAFLWVVSIFILYSQSRIAYEQLPDLIRHKSEMMPKEKFLGIVYGTAIIFNVVFAGITHFLLIFYKDLLPNLFNIPNKDYWLKTPERIHEAGAKMSCGLFWFCVVLNGIFWYIIDLMLRSERMGASQPVSVGIIFMILGGFFVGFVYHHLAFRVPGRQRQ